MMQNSCSFASFFARFIINYNSEKETMNNTNEKSTISVGVIKDVRGVESITRLIPEKIDDGEVLITPESCKSHTQYKVFKNNTIEDTLETLNYFLMDNTDNPDIVDAVMTESRKLLNTFSSTDPKGFILKFLVELKLSIYPSEDVFDLTDVWDDKFYGSLCGLICDFFYVVDPIEVMCRWHSLVKERHTLNR